VPDPIASPQDPAYRAIGRFMVEFSRVISVMQTAIPVVVGSISPGLPVRALQVAVAQDTSASDLANMFFGVCTTVVDLTDEEKQVRNKLRKRVDELVGRRNDIAHGVWAIGVSEGDQTAWDRTVLMRDKRPRRVSRSETSHSPWTTWRRWPTTPGTSPVCS
jgi:hypothetical protein